MFSDDQPVTEVTVSELARRASAVISSVADEGKRVIVSRNTRPVAVITSLDESLDLVLAGSEHFAGLRRDAREAFIAPRAAEALAALFHMHRGRLQRTLNNALAERLAGRGPRGDVFSVRTPTHLAACEVFGGDASGAGGWVVVYAVERLRDIFARLYGPRLEREFDRRWWEAMSHGRHVSAVYRVERWSRPRR